MLQQHLWSTFHLIQAFIPHMQDNGWGRVVVVSSPYANRPAAKGGPYAIGKAAQEALILTLAQELRGSGVTANILQVQTIDVAHERESTPSARNASWTTPEEISAAILYLCSDEARMANGGRLPLYGAPL
jgi:NAD(P)-dependent dehydrogenase (short-subunit alcohol dehydrogenase family)